MTASTIPAAIDGLIALLAASASLTGVQIVDGQPTVNIDSDVIAVGYAEDGAAVSSQQDPRGLGAQRRAEVFDISCTISCWNGKPNTKVVRDRAFVLFDACETAIAAEATLGGAVIYGQVTQTSLTQLQTDAGAVCDLVFTVACESRI